MIILPAIDLRMGKCVRLYKGDFNKTEIVAESAVDTALMFKECGAEYIHIVDLDGALKGKGINLDIVCELIKKVDIPIEFGGGIRDIETIDYLIDIGVSRIILGTAALNNEKLVREAIKRYDDKVAVGIDAKNGYVAVEGWLNLSNVNYIDFAKKMESIGVKNIIFTDISRDGTLNGPNFDALLKLKENINCNITASGGIKDVNDIKKLKEFNIYGAIVGKAIYSNNIDLKEAIKLSEK
ncbi:1-(5-phosphoribosyl)-5-[(5-phosphoribosylamino)methylideneamino]imidazole-4-carboxamide isomerase [Clostridium novyi]|uniref:1-(5-phosphoribosyl)-5-[(5-phosphoribosylamino)methylideneamino] imidazole-4-carboxamide isomerase n=1 Tax=Clostridium novyi (strain NT) TaxID=386415 RepID=HIS4_CLONN|nr:1-(5-phosphoribosyl)-5-[(5-phosphoribosylamino)methylideneamino]imidazole-4-carboxamide isomerase [Clostridium novyi]A0PXP7.1 RecName: Full=1-(5-phosphoribosyl)-5-[(5-phosphoribosylamino)methylideneamino] imidazole-4-carboxamide isomerase; AltName: Full=Phosphoribosylformimino-5-aminoimidazole carboxamide ribotide isomerase [Clostridium novyi NT]ABK60703.1 phosphoribosylformimino-5-aminoimidazole carboxamide ribotide isomerase [Clostridium novyi NT]KEH84911.1 1-(5-phosphoribosyl)-5-[(5-phosph